MGNENNFPGGKDIVIIGITPYDWDLANNCKDMAIELSKHNRVLYVNIPLKRSELLRKKKSAGIQKRVTYRKQNGNFIEKVGENLWNLYPDAILEPINRLKPKLIFDFLNRINNKRYSRSIQQAIKELRFENVILFNDNDIYNGLYLKELLKPSVYVYYIRDMLTTMNYWKMHSVRLEPEMIRRADVVVANSVYIANYAKQFNTKSFYIGQGCDVDHFKKALSSLVIPKDLNDIQRPRIGYIGAITSERLDIDLILFLSKERPTWNFILIGPPDNAFLTSELTNCKNVHFLGRKQFDELPNYLKGLDVCINPQKVNMLTIGNYPRKIDEYLAAGKPVVATRTEAMAPFEEHTYLSENPEEYILNIEKALEDDNEPRKLARSVFASSHTWAHCIDELGRSINDQSK
jgi:glycosyltransferase involved in cell wall biosynthesis